MTPTLQDSPQLDEAMSVSLRRIIEYAGSIINSQALNELDRKLKEISIKKDTSRA